jgi:hypothetical protein
MGLGYTKTAMRDWGGYRLGLVAEDVRAQKESWGAHGFYACQGEDLLSAPRYDEDGQAQG